VLEITFDKVKSENIKGVYYQIVININADSACFTHNTVIGKYQLKELRNSINDLLLALNKELNDEI